MSDHCTAGCLLLIDASLRSLLVAALVAAGLRLWPSRNANVQHRAWTAVLVAMLFMPLLAQIFTGPVTLAQQPGVERAPGRAGTCTDRRRIEHRARDATRAS